MNIEIGKYYVNKTWRFLLPCLRGHGDIFVRKFNPVFKLAVGIHDTLLDGSELSSGRNIYLLCDKKSQEDRFNQFLEWIRYQEYFKGDYCPDADFTKSRKHMIIIEIPEMFHNAYDMFLKGQYSKMYSRENQLNLFINIQEPKVKEFNILSLDSSYIKEFVDIVNKEFDSNVKVSEFQDGLKELELPLKTCEEIFNCNDENQRVFFVEELDKVWN